MVLLMASVPDTVSAGCGGGPDDFEQSAGREHELRTLTDPQTAQLVNDARMKLVSSCQ